MSDAREPTTAAEAAGAPAEVRCLQCERPLAAGEDREVTAKGVFCRACFGSLRQQLEEALRRQGADINYFNAILGGVFGAFVGALIWWGFTVLTSIGFGLVAVVIGFAVGKGMVALTGGKRAPGMQRLALAITALGYLFASYQVNRTFVTRAFAEQAGGDGRVLALPFLPSPELWYEVVALDFGFFDLLFLGIAMWQAWKMTAPLKLAA